MEATQSHTSSTSVMYMINACRFYLQVIFFSEILDVPGIRLIQGVITGDKSNISQSKRIWPFQQKPDDTTW